MGETFDLVIAHPTCTYLANSGVCHLHTDNSRWGLMKEGARFFALMANFNSPRIAIENPIQHKYAVEAHGLGKQTQVIQPYMFGHMEQKATCLWLFGLPKLTPTNDVKAEMLTKPKRERDYIIFRQGRIGGKNDPPRSAELLMQWQINGGVC